MAGYRSGDILRRAGLVDPSDGEPDRCDERPPSLVLRYCQLCSPVRCGLVDHRFNYQHSDDAFVTEGTRTGESEKDWASMTVS
jgi:hypothetical protein